MRSRATENVVSSSDLSAVTEQASTIVRTCIYSQDGLVPDVAAELLARQARAGRRRRGARAKGFRVGGEERAGVGAQRGEGWCMHLYDLVTLPHAAGWRSGGATTNWPGFVCFLGHEIHWEVQLAAALCMPYGLWSRRCDGVDQVDGVIFVGASSSDPHPLTLLPSYRIKNGGRDRLPL